MADLVQSLALGVGLIVLAFFLLHRLWRFSPLQSSLLISLLTLAIYIPQTIIRWPGLDVLAIHLAFYLTACYGLGLIYSIRERRAREEGQADNHFHWPPLVIISFFLILALVDALWITLSQNGLEGNLAKIVLPDGENRAVTSFFPGTVTHDFQEKEALFNDYRAARLLQEQRGWQIKKGWLDTAYFGQPNVFRLQVNDAEGKPLTAAQVEGVFWRLSDKRLDNALMLQEIAPGIYQTVVDLPAPGRWQLYLLIKKDALLHEIRAHTWLREAL